MRPRVLLVELNEVNFDLIARYVERGRLPTFAALLQAHGYAHTTSESRYEELEPWIQWVTAHTGLSLAEHGVFRLGDITKSDIVQIWERLEEAGLRVGAMSPMNAKHRLRDPAFFVPDPWTDTHLTASPMVRRLYQATRQVVNDNSQSRITAGSLAWLALGVARFADPANYPPYLRLLSGARRPWRRAALLDLLLADVFSALCSRHDIDFASIFLNAAAHIQHHYMHSSAVVRTQVRNPDWYCPGGLDPVLEVYEVYDRILHRLRRRFPTHRLLIATGLCQEPHESGVFYWRLKDHHRFLETLDLQPVAVSARMSRDFVAEFSSIEAAGAAAERLAGVRDLDGERLFAVDERDRELFITLTYAKDIPNAFTYLDGNRQRQGLRDAVAFVALKNGAHSGLGYYLDTGEGRAPEPTAFPLASLQDRIMAMLAPGATQALSESTAG